MGFDSREYFSLPNSSLGQKVLIFGADMSYSVQTNNNFILTKKKLLLGLHCMGANSHFFGNDKEITKFKSKDSEIVVNPLCLRNISEDFSVDNMIKIGLYGYVYDFSVDYDFVAVNDILDIHKYLMEKNNIIKNVWIY